MIIVSILYEASDHFDEDYYMTQHMPLVRDRWSGVLSETRILKGMTAPDGTPPLYVIIAELSFATMTDVDQAMNGPHAAEIFGDVANFTDAKPKQLISQTLD
ncbi:EthD family reductase [Sphingomonas sp. PvP056]|jgi:uncharacterized protein (TIGR02118 family)|uniref:EthD family reductase n=1 Tax=Sphingomonas sp. PvP056 TaxID=3156392 RepID=UPI0010E18EB3|nr:EthD family reductase [Sphingomonas sp. PsM26]RYD27462.1 MAG: EthD family reductase [Xanthomonadaceae bacterium]